MIELDDYLERVEHLPPAPRVLPELLALLRDEDIDAARVVRVITYDAALTASVLRACNSAALAAATPAANLDEAVLRLGFRGIYQIAAAVSGAATFRSGPPIPGLDPGELWRHSVAAAVAAELIARDLGDDESVAFTAALLHDLGKLVLAEAMVPLYARVLLETEKNHHSMRESEKLLLGVEHSEIGGRLLARWNFPEPLVQAVWHHHEPGAATPEHGRLASVVYLANLAAHSLGFTAGQQPFALRGRPEVFALLKLKVDDWPRYLIKTSEHLKEIETLLSLKA